MTWPSTIFMEALLQPDVLRVHVEREAMHLARQRPQVVHAIARRGGHRVIPVGDEDGVPVTDGMRDRLPLRRVDLGGRRIIKKKDAEVVDLLEPGLAVPAVLLLLGLPAPV